MTGLRTSTDSARASEPYAIKLLAPAAKWPIWRARSAISRQVLSLAQGNADQLTDWIVRARAAADAVVMLPWLQRPN
ncbi:hypothetical protein ACIREE_13400 [Streptomyces sp. NPDC102467]|uniref:hypothetical protein n=1 Tax=Streptomyces sp. NPDC102467 TaxID=3366179 RepID=UPI00382AE6C7